jgi:hypothetical protein
MFRQSKQVIYDTDTNPFIVYTGSGFLHALILGDKRRFTENRQQKRPAIRSEKSTRPPVELTLLPEKTNEQP